MSRYVIWDEVSPVITPTMEVFTADQWMDRYPAARLESIKLVIAGGEINGAFCATYGQMVDTYRSQMNEEWIAQIDACASEQEVLDVIEAFEDFRNTPVVSDEPTTDERIAAALEAQVMMSLPDDEEA